ncbi:MAG: type II CRISPR RNA-guided endonuclease Cas9 [Chitinophagales bacterium]|nr:type II CRISPR RNA-guided endonuclease Cas9 [Chitinophagales bacterium]
MTTILGLDLGTNSIGWALIQQDFENKQGKILGMGSRIIPMSTDDKDEFTSGNTISKNQKRTSKRTQRKGYDRYQLRRKSLTNLLLKNEMFNDALFKLQPLELWGLRAKAVNEKIELKELGRVLYHLNQKRGYKSSRSDANLDKKDTEYVAEVKSRHQEIKEQGITIGQKFFAELQKDQYYRVKQQVFPREAYIEEFEAICKQQQKHYPQIITDEFIAQLRDEIIYYQRKLKSQKGLVNICEFEGFSTKNKEGKDAFVGPKVAPKSSPLFQICKIWEGINTISLKNKSGETFEISIEQKQELFKHLDNHEKLTSTDLLKILNLKKNDGWYTNKQIERGIQGNITKTQFLKYLPQDNELLTFNLTVKNSDKETYLVDRKTGDVKGSKQHLIIDADIEQQPLYQLWHTIYSIADVEECVNVLIKKFNLDREIAEKLANIDFTKYAFGNKSSKAIRKILPYLMQGDVYSDACSYAGYNHSNSLTKDENIKRILLDSIPNLPKNSLRQPVVEKILNQMINVVNAIIEKHGKPDEIRIELARDLKQNKEERNKTFTDLNKRERENETIRKRLTDEYKLRATRNNVIKWRLFHEINNEESKLNAFCVYCGKPFGITDALSGNNVDVEHIIPKSLLFDDSQSNKTLSHRSCNEAKGNKTAYDFMSSKTSDELNTYIERVDNLFKNKLINKAKRDRLLMPEAKIPKDFIDRQLRETQYIARKSKEILEQVCTNVWSTSGTVTEYLRRLWGWDDVLMNLQLPKYRELGLIEWKEWETNDGQKHKQEVIKDWSKRDDHRHHAVDALVIACTQQGFIQRINNLSSQGNRDEMYAEVGTTRKGSLLENYIVKHRPFTTKEVENKAAEILISFKAGKKVASFGKRKIKKDGKKQVVQTGIIVPRGALSEESVYGKIKSLDKNKPLKYLFENPDLILKGYIKKLVKERLAKHENDSKKAIASLKKETIYLDEENKKVLEYATCYKEEYVIKYPLETIKAKDVEYIVDEKVKAVIKARLEQFGNKEKEAFKTPLFLNEEKQIPIKTVRIFRGLSSIVPVNKDGLGFVKPGNNHHIAFYVDENGKKIEHICTFWHAVERKKYDLPVIIKNPNELWDKILLLKDEYTQDFLDKLPKHNWTFVESLQQNEMFVLGLNEEEIQHALSTNNKRLLNQHLYRVQKISSNEYVFRHHLETSVAKDASKDVEKAKQDSKRYYNIKSIGSFEKLNPRKVRVSNLGEVV